jgi:hypothetical protein
VFYDQGIIPARRFSGLTEAIGADAADGIRVGAPYCHLTDLNIQYFGRDGVNASAGDQDQNLGMGAEDCQFDRLFLGNNRGNGLRVQGGDSNCTQVNGSTFFVNQSWAIDASAFLAGSFLSPQATQNGWDNSENLSANDAIAAIATLVRSSNTVTLTWAEPYTSPIIRPGDGVRVATCPNDPSFVGRWRVLGVADDHRSLTYRQVAADASTTGGTGRANFLPPDGTIASAVRVSNRVTLTTSTPLLTRGGGHASAEGIPFRVGQGITLVNCPDPTFDGTFIVLSVSGDHKTVTYAQAAADATITAGTSRMAIPHDTWKAAGMVGGSYNAPFITARQAWINPYAEGGQRSRFANSNVIIAPTWADNPDFGGDSGWSMLPLIVYGTAPGTGSPGTNQPLGVVWPYDMGAVSLTRVGFTTPQLHTDKFQHPVVDSGVAETFWTQVRGQNEWSLWHGDPATGSQCLRFRLDNTAGYSYLDSEGSGMVRVNADAGTGTGGLLVGDGTGGASTTSIVGGTITATGTIATGHGPREARPVNPAIGAMWFDTTLHMPLWWDGVWRDAMGNPR